MNFWFVLLDVEEKSTISSRIHLWWHQRSAIWSSLERSIEWDSWLFQLFLLLDSQIEKAFERVHVVEHLNNVDTKETRCRRRSQVEPLVYRAHHWWSLESEKSIEVEVVRVSAAILRRRTAHQDCACLRRRSSASVVEHSGLDSASEHDQRIGQAKDIYGEFTWGGMPFGG